MGGIYRWSEWAPPLIWGGNSPKPDRPAIHMAGRPPNSASINFGHRIPHALTLLDTLAKQKLKWHQHLPTDQGGAASWPHFGLVGPELCATSSPHVILSVTMPYFEHIEDMHGFWSIWCFSIIRCSWNGRSTKLMEQVSNKHLYSISYMKCRYVGGKYMHFMTANTAEIMNERYTKIDTR
jgi:hypothetical protein